MVKDFKWKPDLESRPISINLPGQHLVSSQTHHANLSARVMIIKLAKLDIVLISAGTLKVAMPEMTEKLLFKVPESDVNKVHKDIAIEFLSLIAAGRPKDGLHLFAPDCKTHNPYILGGMEALIEAMIAVQKQGSEGIIKGSSADFKLVIMHVLADGDLVAVHTNLSSSKLTEGGLRQAHLFRFEGDKIVEYWDITQMIEPNMPNAASALS